MSRIIYTPRHSALQKKRKRISPLSLRATLLSLGVLILAGGTISLLRLPQGRITAIEISGTEQLDPSAIRAALSEDLRGNYLFFIPKDSFFTSHAGTLALNLRQHYLQIKDIKIEKKFPHTLAVTIEERDLFGIFCPTPAPATNTDSVPILPPCAFIDTTGFTYREAPRSSGSLILKITEDTDKVTIGESAIDPALLRDMQTFKNGLARSNGLHVTSFQLKTALPHEIRVSVSEGFDLWFDRTQDSIASLDILKTVLGQEVKNRQADLAYVDLRFGNKVFYKFKKK